MEVIILKSALDDIGSLESNVRDRIFKTIEKLSKGEIKPKNLSGNDKGYKIKAGKYRIIWKYKKEKIVITRVGARKEVYRNL
jgi:mRNA-degrading endonuclease RelE of RelBE toxin-antitoxin system